MNDGTPFTLRPASSADAEALARLIVAAFSSYPDPLDPPSSALKETPEAIRARLAGGHGAAIAWVGGRGVGCVTYTPEDEDVLYVGRLAVDSAWRGRGVARALIAHAETEARRRGLRTLRVRVRVPLVGNQRLFRSCGFVEIARECHEGYSEPTTIRMEKRLQDVGRA
jgi:GNAT superfamily N-acetyltransferase